ncbi:thioredoxin domain-containing protein [Paenibacillus woosongensis]|uniref:Thioredoxin domain-containing protein n=1 Tax=Paenibacillus woosongensis TaxID=307580 RepID=A0AA95I7E4_9BACL|nr:thioredoxin domain-containing protein [Paenibacillus woosongensis]WHX47987.1 thioredoxin domain-containing protein [Paenibacillus woosongensis]
MPPKKQTNALAQRKSEQMKQQQKQKTRRVIWFSTVGVLLALCIIVLLIPTKPKAEAFEYAGLPVLGDPNAPIKIVEFGDYKCPACSIFNELVKPQIQSDYVDQGKAAFYFMNYPFLGPDSDTAALAAQSVYHQSNEAFWTYFDALYTNQGNENEQWATVDYLVELAQKENIGIDYDLLRKDIEEKTYQNEVDEHRNKANQLRVQGTPTIFINGKPYNGNFGDYTEIKKAIENELKGE